MREFEYIFDTGLLHGTRPFSRSRSQQQQLIEGYNVVSGVMGIEPYVSLDMASGALGSMLYSHRFPAVFNAPMFSTVMESLAGVNRLYVISDSTLEYVESLEGELTSSADFGFYSVLAGLGGMALVSMDTNSGIVSTSSHKGSTNMPWMGTCCNFRGQLIGGNILSDWGGCGSQSIVYSDIGSINMIPGRSNVAGNHYIPTAHTIIKVLPLGNNVIVYTTGGIFALKPVSAPVPGFALTSIAPIGTLNTLAVAGSDSMHIVIDHLGQMWEIIGDLRPKLIGYKEVFKDDANDLSVVFDGAVNQWRINTSSDSYVYSTFGLTSCFQSVTGIYYNADNYSAFGSESHDRSALIVTDKTDFGYRGIKTIHGIELSADTIPGAKIAIDYKFNLREKEFKRGRFHQVNSIGQSSAPQAGTDFRIVVQFDDYRDVLLDYIKVRFKMSDMRGIRGVYSPPPRGQYAG